MPLTKPKGVGEITSVTTPLVHTRSRCSVLSTLLESDQRCPPWPTAAAADAMRTPCGRKPYLRLLDRCFLPALTAFTLGQDLIVLLFLTTFAYLLMHQNRDLPAGAVTRRSTFTGHGSYCKLRDWDRDREVDRIPLCVNDWGLPQDCAIP